jgi:hypothetical protein
MRLPGTRFGRQMIDDVGAGFLNDVAQRGGVRDVDLGKDHIRCGRWNRGMVSVDLVMQVINDPDRRAGPVFPQRGEQVGSNEARPSRYQYSRWRRHVMNRVQDSDWCMRNSRSKSAGDTSTIEKTVARFSYVGKAILKFRTGWRRGGKKMTSLPVCPA